ncbi:MATE efflux family protein [Thermoanaerobacterium xylanolyticum LX-11]|uniref:Probable multidrug resistance protein NorM n=1 Tax=Thermoanaerobacterium xylanolyticum (strain ATCC 49914 / DSM 7097 / LX-11) TaxID=858215 RepID=F6BKB2_THEXL|nr:MATE family efflux transporter [Thermoanaerobacterium xylanolyticum]AEF18059.1 MATE efflux family protein [Thermoanaerobacterium xylanolyticum LX-11]
MVIKKDILKLIGPIITEQTFISSMGIINTILASRLGKEAISSIGMADSINNILIGFFSALAVGGTVVVAQYVGQKNQKAANEASKQIMYSGELITIFITILIWILRHPIVLLLFGKAEKIVFDNAILYLSISLVTYPFITAQLVAFGVLRGAGDTKTPMYINVFINVLNVILSYAFIYGIKIINLKGLGVEGAAIGIGLSRLIGAIVALYILIKGTSVVKLYDLWHFRPDIKMLRSIFNIGLPAGLESLLFSGGKLITQVFVVLFGTASIAANSIGFSVQQIFNIPGNALSIASTIVVGQDMGSGDPVAAKKSLYYMTWLASICMGILGAVSFPFARFLVSIYTTNQDVIDIAVKVVRLNLACMVLWSLSFVLPAGLKGAGDAKYTLMTSIIGMWAFRIVLGYVLGVVMKFGLVGVWIGMFTDWAVRGTLYLIRLRGTKWQKAIV